MENTPYAEEKLRRVKDDGREKRKRQKRSCGRERNK